MTTYSSVLDNTSVNKKGQICTILWTQTSPFSEKKRP